MFKIRKPTSIYPQHSLWIFFSLSPGLAVYLGLLLVIDLANPKALENMTLMSLLILVVIITTTKYYFLLVISDFATFDLILTK